jgi:hypothetical protein
LTSLQVLSIRNESIIRVEAFEREAGVFVLTHAAGAIFRFYQVRSNSTWVVRGQAKITLRLFYLSERSRGTAKPTCLLVGSCCRIILFITLDEHREPVSGQHFRSSIDELFSMLIRCWSGEAGHSIEKLAQPSNFHLTGPGNHCTVC